MGNASAGHKPAASVEQMFSVVHHDQSEGTTMLLEKGTGNEYCMKELTTNSRHDLEVFNRHIQQKQRNKHPNVLSVVFYKVQPIDGLCSQSNRCFIITEHPFRTLYDEPFSEGELLSILYSCVAGLQHLYSQGFKHQSLTSNRIYIDKSGLIKISDPQLLRQPDNLSSISSHSNKEHIYLSPEQLRASFGRHQQWYSSERSEVFTLGIIMLEAMQLEWMDEMYDPTSINVVRMKKLLDNLNSEKYGKDLRALMRGMLENVPEARLSLKEVEQIIDGMDLPQQLGKPPRKKNYSSEADPFSLRSSHLHEADLPSRIVVNVEPLDPQCEGNSSQNHKIEVTTRCPPSFNGNKPSIESSQLTLQSQASRNPPDFHVSKTTKGIPHKTIQLEVSKIDREDAKARHSRRRSRSDKSNRGYCNGLKNQNVCSFKKKLPNKQHPEQPHSREVTPQETPNKIYEQFYPFTQFVDDSNKLRESKKHINNIPSEPALLKSDEKCIRVDLFSAKKKRTSSKVKNSASINNSPRPVMVNIKKFEVKQEEERCQLQQTATEPTIKGTPEHLKPSTNSLSVEPTERELRIKTDYYYEEHFIQEQVEHNFSNPLDHSVMEFRTRLQRLHISNSMSLHSPQRLRRDIIEDVEISQRIPTEPESTKKITFGLDQSHVEERDPLQPAAKEYYKPTNYQADIQPLKSDLKPTQTSLKESEPIRIQITLPLPEVIQPSAALLRRSLKEAISDELIVPLAKPPQSTQLEYINQTYKHGGRYEGFKLNNLREGFGRYFYQDGGYYEGEWHRNKMTGFAKLYYQNGEIAYEGYWNNDMFNGTGKLWNDCPEHFQEPFDYRDFSKVGSKWVHYSGCFLDDVRIGVGTLTLTNGERYEGEFREDQLHGCGKFYAMDGTVHSGTWLNDCLQP